LDNSSYYKLLDVSKSASADEIKRAYRKVALKYHPDRNPSEEAKERFKMAAEAYEVLRNPDKRRTYDTYGRAGLEREGFSGFDDMGDIFSNLGSIFGDIFGYNRRRGPTKAPRGANVRVKLNLSLKEAAEGIERVITFKRPTPCTDCDSTGARSPKDMHACPDCNGTGRVTHSQHFMMIATTCPGCKGNGRIIVNNCEACNGKAHVLVPESITVQLPAGIDHGEQLHVSGLGAHNEVGAGDLYIVVQIDEDPDLVRHGDDIHSTVDVDMVDAALGTTITLRGLYEALNVRIPAGTQPDEVINLANKGMPCRLKHGIGRHFVHVNVVIPLELNQKQRNHLNEYLKSGIPKKTG